MITKAGKLSDNDLIEHIKNLSPKIKQLTIYPTELCNYRCKMCHIWGDTGWARKNIEKIEKEQLDIEVLKNFIDQVVEVNPGIGVIITGGEPMLYKHFRELVTYLREKKVKIYLLTNGALIKDNIDFIIKNVTALSISIDGDKNYHDGIRGKGSFDTVCDNIELLINRKKESKKLLPFITVTSCISKYNSSSIKDLLYVLRERFTGKKVILHDHVHPLRKPRDLTLNLAPLLFTTKEKGEEYKKQMKENLNCDISDSWKGFLEESIDIDTEQLNSDLKELWEREGVDTSRYIDIKEYFNNIDNNFGRSKCFAPWFELAIRRNGDVYPCTDYADYKLGNIYTESFSEIFNGDRAEKFRSYLKKENLAVCNRCTRIFADKESY